MFNGEGAKCPTYSTMVEKNIPAGERDRFYSIKFQQLGESGRSYKGVLFLLLLAIFVPVSNLYQYKTFVKSKISPRLSCLGIAAQ